MPNSSNPASVPPTERRIGRLSEVSINQIAAGEVLERPASAVKELIENAIDADATRIEITVVNAGRNLIRVADNGCGIASDDLKLAVERHATSKISDANLNDIRTLGFRGEALPSMGSVGQLTVKSRWHDSDRAFQIEVDSGNLVGVRPAALREGTIVELRQLFSKTPARLKFLRSNKAETRAINSVVRTLAMATPKVGYSLHSGSETGRLQRVLSMPPESESDGDPFRLRLTRLFKSEFLENTVAFERELSGVAVRGFCGLPTYVRSATSAQHFFVNGRGIRDRLFLGLVRGAYGDLVSSGKHPVIVLFMECPSEMIDVNVHPAKTEIRFREPGLIRAVTISAIQDALAREGHRTAPSVSRAMTSRLAPGRPESTAANPDQADQREGGSTGRHGSLLDADATAAKPLGSFEPAAEPGSVADPKALEHPLGAARMQVHRNYIVSQTADGIVLVDQHAAAERLVFEELKKAYHAGKPDSRALLVPEVVELEQNDIDRLLEVKEELAALGLTVDRFGPGAVCVRQIPAILGEVSCKDLLQDIADGLGAGERVRVLEKRMNDVLSTIACHGSIRSGSVLSVNEMNALLRKMEVTPHSGQCNHGRPTWLELKLSDIERMFGRR
ncbi:MAG: DNA mismatch repair endonuclease MutL [Rhodobacteraceae bacterium]|nr:DNA mismatch repair endonuclease MutL [Paracoccaceae bacterium]